jgi:hypothetical protein
MAVSMVGPPKTDCPRVREKVIWESLYPILGSIRPHGLVKDGPTVTVCDDTGVATVED